jgi:hypothetical protein
MAGQGVTLYATTAGGNKAIVGTVDWREAIYMPAQINDNVAQIMADIRAMANAIANGWIEVGDGDGVYTAAYVAANQFQFSGMDVRSIYRVGMRVRVVAPTPGTISGTITAVAFTTNTVITVAWDSGAGLSNEAITSVLIGIGSGPGGGSGAGSAVRHDCRLDRVSNSIARLSGYGGNQLTIAAQPVTIPAAGVDLAFSSGWAASAMTYVYATYSGGVITLAGSNNGPVVDARDGNVVMNGNADATLVGAVVNYGTGIYETGRLQSVASYWNRCAQLNFTSFSSVSTASLTAVDLASPVYFITFGQDTVYIDSPAYASNSAAGAYSVYDFRVNVTPQGVGVLAHAPGAGYLTPMTVSFQIVIAPGVYPVVPQGQVGSGNATYNGKVFVSSQG